MTLQDVPDKRSCLMSEFALGCDSCNESSSFTTLVNAATRGRSLDINRRAVYHSVETGSDYESHVWRLVAAFLTCLVFLGLFTTSKLKASWDHLKKKQRFQYEAR